MLHLFIYDDIKFSDINLPKFCFITSVNITNNAMDKDISESPTSKSPLHKLIRYEEFISFDRKTRRLLKRTPELYMKYGGICFMYDGEEEVITRVKNHLELVLKQDYEIDPLHNNILLEKSSQSSLQAVADKMILKAIFKYKDISLLAYGPTKKFFETDRKVLMKMAENLTPKMIKNNTEMFRKRYKI